jgi:hypothetical protein
VGAEGYLTAPLRLRERYVVLQQEPLRLRKEVRVAAILHPGATCHECGHRFQRGDRCERIHVNYRYTRAHYYLCAPCHETRQACQALERLS